MIKREFGVQELNNSPIILEKYKTVKTEKSIIDYLEKINSEDVGQIKIYLGFLYFVILLFLSITLFL